MRILRMPCRIEELPFLADFVRDYYVRDHADFLAFSPVYEETWLTDFDKQVIKVNGLVATSLLMAQQKVITGRIKKHYKKARNYVNKVERYSQLAAGTLKTDVADFGFLGLREEIQLSNDEGVSKKFRDLLQHIELNKEPLETAGLTPAFLTELETFIDTFETDSKGQTRKVDERLDTTGDNDEQYDILWNLIDNILKSGKTIYKDKEEEKEKKKVEDYTYELLIKKVRLAQQKKEDEDKNKGGAA